jgi:poly(hydroxyalkanoate) granule-associated protein
MVKKAKTTAGSKQDAKQLAKQVSDSAQQIWLAGLGAFSKAREDRAKAFEQLVKEGKSLQLRSRAFAEERINEMTGRLTEVKDNVSKQATESWDRLEQVFEERVSRALGRLGVPTSRDIQALIKRVDTLTASVQAMGGKAPVRAAAAAKKPAKARARKGAAKARKAA